MKRSRPHFSSSQAKKQRKAKPTKEGSHEEVLLADVRRLLKDHLINKDETDAEKSPTSRLSNYKPPDRFSQIEVHIAEISSIGDGLGLSPECNHVYVVPFTVPGDTVRAKVIHHFPNDNYTLADFAEVIKPSSQRDDSLVGCQYFTKCGGCQLQMLSYENQLAHKKTVIERAYRNFSNLAPYLIPLVEETFPSPLRYGYRTKLTPHFDRPPGSRHRNKGHDDRPRKIFEDVPSIGFLQKGTRRTIDIEDCPIGTDAVRKGMKRERERVAREIRNYSKGATILLRESTIRMTENSARGKALAMDTNINLPSHGSLDRSTDVSEGEIGNPVLKENNSIFSDQNTTDWTMHRENSEQKICITDSNAITTEYIGPYTFHNPAGSFFQNNNSILPSFTEYIREHVLLPAVTSSEPSINYLIDAYCGSGLFTVTLSSLFSSSTGIDISGPSINFAHQNAEINGITNASFMAADASALFAKVTYPPDETVIIIDPPRKGCDDNFLQQLLNFKPRRIVYVSCNVHTQARDVGILVEGKPGCSYDLESLRGFDFFPQTGQVESVAILNRKGSLVCLESTFESAKKSEEMPARILD